MQDASFHNGSALLHARTQAAPLALQVLVPLISRWSLKSHNLSQEVTL